jgi:hypothetical protein
LKIKQLAIGFDSLCHPLSHPLPMARGAAGQSFLALLMQSYIKQVLNTIKRINNFFYFANLDD